ncbi:MAG: efflux RND transporter permease subunit [Bryobacteraceae bacterium]|nr:efflux RND transporter permease subunit [Bryobacteraceae bacterium]
MNLVRGTLRYPQVTLLLSAAIFAAGIHALLTMPRREDPKITIRTGLVIAQYLGATAEQVEKQVTEKIEERLFRFSEVRKAKTHSVSRTNVSVTYVELEDSVSEPDLFWSKLRHALLELKATSLPAGVQGPVVNDGFGDTVAWLLAVHGGNYSYQQLKEYAETIENEFRSLRAVAKLARLGEQREEIRISSSMGRVSQYDLSPLQVIAALRGRNTVEYGGSLKTGAADVPLKTSGLFQTEEEIRRLIVGMSRKTGQPIHLGDLAEVHRIDGEPRTLARFQGERAVLISVEMLEGYNIVEFGSELRGKLAGIRKILPPDLQVDLIADQPAVVADRIAHFIREFGIAIASVILVTMLLLPMRVAVIASLAIPVTVAATFALLDAIGVELHQVSISALIVVLGMVVDDAIVIADNYVEMLDRGVERAEAAWRAASELTVPVLTATLTIIAAFLPMLMISGAVGEFIQALPVAVAVSLGSSFVVAMLLTPWLCRFFIRKGLHTHTADEAPARGGTVLDRLQRSYHFAIHTAMRNKALTLAAGAAAIILAAFVLKTAVPERFFPAAERPQFVINLWLPEGSRLEATDAATSRIEGFLRREKLVANVSAFIGESAPRFYYNVDPEFPAANFAQLLVNTRGRDGTVDLIYRLRRELPPLAPSARVIVRELEQGKPMSAPVEVRLTGLDIARLRALGDSATEILRGAGGVEYLFTDFHEDAYSVDVNVDHEVANRLGLSTATISLQLAGGFSGLPVSTFWEGDRDVPVVLRLDEFNRRDFDDLRAATMISTLTGANVPLHNVARLEPAWRPNRIAHRNGLRTLTVLAYPKEGELASAILARARPALDAMNLPGGYRLDYGGEKANQDETFGEMKVVLAVSIVLIFLILLFQFRSVAQVIVVMMSIPLAFPGAVLGLVITNNPFSFTAFLGLISLGGVVVRNAIILVEYMNERRAAGADVSQAALEAGERRLRPIFLTTAAAAVGVTPMILSGSTLWSPLASVIAIGLLLSMFFTLLVVPVLYVVIESRPRSSAPAAALIGLLLLTAAPARAEARPISLDQALEMARKQNSLLQLARLKVREQQRRRDAVRANLYPALRNQSDFLYNTQLQAIVLPAGSLGVVPGAGPLPSADLSLVQGLNKVGLISTTLGQPLTQLVKIRAGSNVSQTEVAAAEEDVKRAELAILLKTREAFYGLLISGAKQAAAAARAAALEEALREASDAVEAGSALDVKRREARAGLLEARNAVLSAEIERADIEGEFNELIGASAASQWTPIMPDLPVDQPVSEETAVRMAMEANPEVRAARLAVRKAEFGLKAARADYIPEITAYAQHVYQSGVPFLPGNNFIFGGRLAFTLWDSGKRRAETGERGVQIEMARRNQERIERRVSLDLRKALRKTARMRDLVSVASEAAAVRRELLRIASDRVEVGQATRFTLLEAQANLLEAEAKALSARLSADLAQAEADQIAGR